MDPVRPTTPIYYYIAIYTVILDNRTRIPNQSDDFEFGIILNNEKDGCLECNKIYI